MTLLDSMLCDGDAKNPQPKANIDQLTEFHTKGENIKTGKHEEHRVKLKEWIGNLRKGKDLLSEADAVIDAQMGGLKSAREEAYGHSNRMVPPF
ncbi:uncharacterized protein ATNIH1004_003744 [Aspergillus tanneri]|uniref:Uncharacterized protein n=1 Tax=Aspergillus tanneri TaxID=1220188 RepID=A0A5M9MVA3_9EURO|nr:uncharacterized protein ATNIH1004_003744 [Aspergillus tanneri]KAA8651051.1 hypothetical protein ATNIH1004_003744 [Aspergillus tanneri]